MESKEIKRYIITEDEVNRIIQIASEAGARAAMEKFQREKEKVKKDRKDKRLHNTKLLLRNYRALKAGSENSIFSRSQMEESAADILDSMMNLYDDEVIVSSIKRSASRTAIMLSHIRKMIDLYEALAYKSGDELDIRRYEIMTKAYVDEDKMNINDLAERYNMSKDTVYKDLKIAEERVSSLIFGVDCLF